MKQQRELLAQQLIDDATLLGMLEANAPWWEPDGTQSKENSIIPSIKAPLPNTPFVTIQYSSDNGIGENLRDAFFLIRCYNAGDKTFVEIDEVLQRVHALLHRHRFDYTGLASIDTVYESTGAELEDEAFGLNFREARYRVLYL